MNVGLEGVAHASGGGAGAPAAVQSVVTLQLCRSLPGPNNQDPLAPIGGRRRPLAAIGAAGGLGVAGAALRRAHTGAGHELDLVQKVDGGGPLSKKCSRLKV